MYGLKKWSLKKYAMTLTFDIKTWFSDALP